MSDSASETIFINYQPHRWGRSLSSAVDAYRHMIRLKQDLETRAMKLSPIEKLSANCPRCFGPHNEPKKADEPDYIGCIDGNFQQRRHMEASVEISQIEVQYPNLFLHPNQVKKWENRNGLSSNNAPVRITLLCLCLFLHLATEPNLFQFSM